MTITTLSDLAALARRLRDHGAFALDMEFERERSYWPKLQLIQVAIPGEAAAVDPLAVSDLSPLLDLIADPSVEKVTHAGRQDAEIFYLKSGKPPRNLYDTQIAAALLGLGEQVGYGALVHRMLGVKLEKKERITDWGRRPLTPGQLEYALDDVRYLLPIRDKLNEDLEQLGRREWFRQELTFYEDPGLYEPDPDRLYMKVSRWRSLNRRGLGILRELVAWRESEAGARDVPRQRVVPDDVMVDLSLRKPQRVADLRPLRRLHPREIERSGEAIVAAVRRGLDLADADLPNPPQIPREDPEATHAVDLLGVLLKIRAREIRIAPSYLGTSKDLAVLVDWLSGPRTGKAPALLNGWRRDAVGEDLAALYDGKTLLRMDPQSRTVVVEPAGDAPGDRGPAPSH
jgi:ribonuclease D